MNQVRVWLSGLVASGAVLALASATAFGSGRATAEAIQAAGAVDVDGIYKQKCQVCHAADGNSPLPGMSFADGVWKHGSSVKEVAATITNGVPGTAMVSWKSQMSDAEIQAMAAFVRKFDPKLPSGKAPAKTAAKKKTGN